MNEAIETPSASAFCISSASISPAASFANCSTEKGFDPAVAFPTHLLSKTIAR
jgi:hypothetical protein